MLDENLPTYRIKPSSENPLHSLLYFTHNGSDPSPDYLMKRPPPASSKNQYALGLLDVHYSSVIYAEVLVTPTWSQPTLSAAEVRASNGGGVPTPLTPDTFSISLYNPDQVVVVKHQASSWNKSESWEFEVPESSFKQPSVSKIDQESHESRVSELTPKVVFRWKRDGRLSRDMTCYLSGKSVGGKKSKEPDITVALFTGGKSEGAVTIYEPNMARVDVEDRKGLEVVFLLSAEVIRDLYLNPRTDPFNTAGGGGPPNTSGRRADSHPAGSPPILGMSGALGNVPTPSPPPRQHPSPPMDPRREAEIDAETKRLQAMVAEEERQARERQKRDAEEEKRVKRMVEKEEKERRRREAEVEKETERLRKEYGMQGQASPGGTAPIMPPRPGQTQLNAPPSGGWYGPPGQRPLLPPRPNSVGPSPNGYWPPGPPQQPPQQSGRSKFTQFLQGPNGGASGASSSGFFGSRTEEEKRKKISKKRSVHF